MAAIGGMNSGLAGPWATLSGVQWEPPAQSQPHRFVRLKATIHTTSPGKRTTVTAPSVIGLMIQRREPTWAMMDDAVFVDKIAESTREFQVRVMSLRR
jgi:hypothetical protein